MPYSLGKFVKCRRGGLTTTFAVSAPILAAAIALGFDIGRAELARKQAQRAAEAAAVSAAVAYQANANGNLAREATQVAAKFGFTGTTGASITVNRPPTSGANAGVAGAVEVIVQQPQPSYFAGLVWPGGLDVDARAVAKGGPNVCVLALDPTAPNSVAAQGSVSVAASNCSIYSNSASADAISSGGSSAISAYLVSTVGGVVGGAGITAQSGVLTGQNATPDPYASVPMPTYSGCAVNNATYKYTEYLLPGVYCGGMTLNSGANVTLSPGTYIMDRGALTVNGGATLQGSGVTIVFTSSNANNYATAEINDGAVLNLTPPTSGPYAGIVFYGDRSMPPATSFNLAGGSNQYLGGAVYLPQAAVSYSGNSSTSSACTQIIVGAINFVGNSGITLNCAGVGVKNIGGVAKVLE